MLFGNFRYKIVGELSLRGRLIEMSNPYKTREGGATVTVFVPYDCQNNCPFCINKKEYADVSSFSLDTTSYGISRY